MFTVIFGARQCVSFAMCSLFVEGVNWIPSRTSAERCLISSQFLVVSGSVVSSNLIDSFVDVFPLEFLCRKKVTPVISAAMDVHAFDGTANFLIVIHLSLSTALTAVLHLMLPSFFCCYFPKRHVSTSQCS